MKRRKSYDNLYYTETLLFGRKYEVEIEYSETNRIEITSVVLMHDTRSDLNRWPRFERLDVLPILNKEQRRSLYNEVFDHVRLMDRILPKYGRYFQAA